MKLELPFELHTRFEAAARAGRKLRITPTATTAPRLTISAPRPTVAAAVVCHAPYEKYLADQLDCVDAQTEPPDEKWACLDGFAAVPDCVATRPDWHVIAGDFGSPNFGRNAALKETVCDWISFLDADDFCHVNYFRGIRDAVAKADDRTGIVFSDLNHSNGQVFHTPAQFDYWKLRLQNYVSAASGWRVAAARDVGGFQQTSCYDDWTLALNMTALGWKAVKNQYPIMVRSHASHRRDAIGGGGDMDVKWDQWTYSIVTLLAGRRDRFDDWYDWLLKAALPPKTSLRILDNSGDPTFREAARLAVNGLIIKGRFRSIELMSTGKPCDLASDEWARHRHVPNLYNQILPGVHEDMVVTLEDDVVPPLDGLRDLVAAMPAGSNIGSVSAAYPSRNGADRLAAAWGPLRNGADYWSDCVTESDVAGMADPIPVGFFGGGFGLWRNALVKRFLPFRFQLWSGVHASGWDSNVCRDIRGAGYQLLLHPGVRCEHNYT